MPRHRTGSTDQASACCLGGQARFRVVLVAVMIVAALLLGKMEPRVVVGVRTNHCGRYDFVGLCWDMNRLGISLEMSRVRLVW